MKIVKGNKLVELNSEQFTKKRAQFRNIVVDLGTGNGRFVFKSAQKNNETLYIGIDPVEKQLQRYSKKAVKQNVENALFVLGTAEEIPEELANKVTEFNIILPWGSLLDYVANFDEKIIKSVQETLIEKGILKIIFGYTREEEPTETERLQLKKLNDTYIIEQLIPQYERIGLNLIEFRKINQQDLSNIDSSWSKRLSRGKERPIYLLEFQKIIL